MNPKLKARLFVLLIFFACAAPVALSTLAYYVWKPEKRMNYGELLQASPLSFAQLKLIGGNGIAGDTFEGKWVLLLIDQSSCGDACERRLYAMRQTTLAMEVKKDKLAEAWMIDSSGAPKRSLLAQYPRTTLIAGDAVWLQQLPQPMAGRIFLIDPNGLPVLRYPEDPDIKRMMKDLGRLLDVKRM